MIHRSFMPMLAASVLTAFALSAQAPPAAQPGRGGRGPQGPQVTSPEVTADRHIVFRIVAPQAESVTLNAGDIPLAQRGGQNGPEFTKGEQGVWEATIGPVDPGAYRYRFSVSGVLTMDPRNPDVSLSNTNAWSIVYVPGSDISDAKQVPHGAVAKVAYYSTALGRFRRMHIYTPPGYELGGNQKFPVFYLLHGAGDNDDAWTSVGRAGFILDNLIAAKKARPMVVVMPAGHTTAQGFGRGAATPGAAPPRDEFYDDFTTDVMPYVEKHYRVLSDRPNRAIAGLSMGGSQTLNIAFRNLAKFAYIGVYSSGAVLGGGRAVAPGAPDWEGLHKADLDNPALKKGTKLVWLRTGVDDGLIANTRATVDLLKKHGFEPVFKESPGAHTWINWRNYLNEFAPLLFQ
jgi:enterochelin esterase-like enzyme